jgi:hypothetical protein
MRPARKAAQALQLHVRHGGGGEVMRLANLNAFIPSLILAEAFLSTPAMLLVSILTMPFRSFIKGNDQWLYLVPQLLVFVSIVFISVKYDLSPTLRKPERERRYRAGHWLIGITTIATFTTDSIPFLLAKIYRNNDLILYTWYAIPVIGIGLFTWTGGLYMVRSSHT